MRRLKDLYLRHERLLMPLTMVVGFVVDYVTFTSIQIGTTLAILIAYWALAASAIAFIHLYDAGKITQKLKHVRLFSPLLIQFTFGALLGGSFIFYWFSGSFWASWPFILILIALMVANDALRHHFQKPVIQIGTHFFISLCLFSIVLPYLSNSMNELLFVAAAALSLVFVYAFVRVLSAKSETVRVAKPRLQTTVWTVLFGMALLYFTNMIPPIPLALREAGAYHNVRRSAGSYILSGEPRAAWMDFVSGQTVHLAPGERVYAYSAIIAPADLNTTITHHWQYRDPKKNIWVTTDKQSFPILGGRNQGYRGYSWKTNPAPGEWRVYVETAGGKVLGRIKFEVEAVATPLPLEETIH